jgi:hypothetical protein
MSKPWVANLRTKWLAVVAPAVRCTGLVWRALKSKDDTSIPGLSQDLLMRVRKLISPWGLLAEADSHLLQPADLDPAPEYLAPEAGSEQAYHESLLEELVGQLEYW